jgi:hypothetical protein
MKKTRLQTKTAGPFDSWTVVCYWALAAVATSLIPFLLLLLDQHVPLVREILRIGEDRHSHIPILGWMGYRLRGQALWVTLATTVSYGGIGLALCAWGGSLSYSKGWRTLASDYLFLLAVAFMLVVVPLLSVSWSLAWQRGAIPSVWGEYGGNHGPWYRVYDLRYLLDLTFDMPLLGLMSGAASVLIRFSIPALVACTANGGMFLSLLYTHYWLVD